MMSLSFAWPAGRLLRNSSYRRSTSLAALSLLGLSGLAHGAPTVEGQVIVLPDDGWYQVQDRADYHEVCAGVRTCEVPAGSYIVINHTTGERFENVRVGLDPDDGQGLVITANGVSWPDDGWYQVQRAATYESLCQGGRSCSLAPGQYIVINHTSGQRWEDIVVPEDSHDSLQAVNLHYERYSSSAIELFWERKPGAQSPIEYTVYQDGVAIGSTRGISFFIEGLAADQAYEFEVRPFDLTEGISISVAAATDAHDSTEERELNLANATDVLAGIVSVINEEAIDALYDTAARDLNFQGKFFQVSDTIDDIVLSDSGEPESAYPVEIQYGRGRYDDATRYATYTCAGGGSITVYDAFRVQASDSVFDACVAGSNTYSGTSGYRDVLRASVFRYPAYDFTVSDGNGNTRTLSGGYEYASLSTVISDIETGWESAFYRGPVDGGQLQIDDYTMLRKRVDTQFTHGPTVRPGDDGEMISVQDHWVEDSVSGDFAVQAPWSNDQLMHVVVNLSFRDDVVLASDPQTGEPVSWSGTDPEEPFHWQEGSIEVLADDGSRLSITPVEGEYDTFTITTGEGETLGPLLWEDGFAVLP